MPKRKIPFCCIFFKSFQISSNYFSVHKHFKGEPARKLLKKKTTNHAPTLRRLVLLVNNLYLANLNARPIFVPPLGYLMRPIARNKLCLFLYLLKLAMSHAWCENSTIPTRVCVGEILNEATNRLTKLRHRRKFPRPWALILPEPSIKRAKSRRLRHTKQEQIERNQHKGLALLQQGTRASELEALVKRIMPSTVPNNWSRTIIYW